MSYFQKVPREKVESVYEGDLFVFDDRVVIDARQEKREGVRVCFRCRWPLTEDEVNGELAKSERGTFACPKCNYDDFLNEAKKKRKRTT